MSKQIDDQISIDSPAYGRLLVKAIKDASATRNVYYFVRAGTQWVTSATYQEDSNSIQINTPRGPVSVHAREWQNLRDSHGRSIVATQALHGESHAQQSLQQQESEASERARSTFDDRFEIGAESLGVIEYASNLDLALSRAEVLARANDCNVEVYDRGLAKLRVFDPYDNRWIDPESQAQQGQQPEAGK